MSSVTQEAQALYWEFMLLFHFAEEGVLKMFSEWKEAELD